MMKLGMVGALPQSQQLFFGVREKAMVPAHTKELDGKRERIEKTSPVRLQKVSKKANKIPALLDENMSDDDSSGTGPGQSHK